MPSRQKASFKQRASEVGIGSSDTEPQAIAITSSFERQRWLEAAVEALRAKFADAGYAIPDKVRVSIGWPKRAASCGAIGECWATEASSDRHAELFISPELTDGARIAHVLRTSSCTRRSARRPDMGRRLNSAHSRSDW